MKKIFLTKIAVLILTIPLYNICIGQDYVPENVIENPIEAAEPEAEVVSPLYQDPQYNFNTIEEESLVAERELSRRDAANPLDAPPDCPECIPDPGDGVADVPFDKNLLFILLVGATIIIVKSNRRKKEIPSDKMY